jgi:hypothetical protein
MALTLTLSPPMRLTKYSCGTILTVTCKGVVVSFSLTEGPLQAVKLAIVIVKAIAVNWKFLPIGLTESDYDSHLITVGENRYHSENISV